MDIQKNLNMDNQISINMEIQKSIKKSKEKIPKKYKNFPDKRGSKKGDDDKQIKSPKNLKRKANEEENIASKKSKQDDKTENCDEKKDSIKRPETKMISVEVKKKENKKEEKLHEPSKKLEIFSSCLVTNTSPDSDDELEDLGLQELPENTPRYITHCDDTEFLPEDDLNSETSSVTGIMTPTFPVENTDVNKNSERDIYRKSKRMEERKKEEESVTMPIDPSQIKTEHPDIFDIDSLVQTINRNSEICPRKFNRSYRDIETEMIMTEITGSQTGSPVQKETVVNIKKEPNSSPIKSLMQMAMQKGLEDSDQWGNYSEFDIDSVVNVVNSRDEWRQLADCHVNIVKIEDQGRQLADCHVNIVKIEDQGRQLEDGIVNFVNRENHGRELEDSNITIVKEEIQRRQLEEEAYLQMDDIEALVHYTNRKSHSVSPSKNNASQQPSLSAKPKTIVGLRLTDDNKGSKCPNKKGDYSLSISPKMKKNYKLKDCSVVLDTDKDIQSKLLNLHKNAESGKEDMNSSVHD
ncbi:uncharacterized protein LOC127706963 isoform X2 [Mytilus californianus]|uniref:uncharacterized protein LOC127706963 isoform X2 n=1 Tax=Mytilus californianus TaxID=6549 RepID=UPI002245331B|nr:uncharacterized protein LOC127706963 isoform X2 [Mytilus californianus]